MATARTDPQGYRLSGASATAADRFAEAVEAFNFFLGDPIAPLDAALADSPAFAMAHLMKAHLFALTTETEATALAEQSLAAAQACAMDAREASHAGALTALIAGNWTQAAQLLDRHQMDWPRDIVALQSGHNIDFFRADARDLRDRVARALPEWSPDVPGHSVVLGMYAFGLEEAGDYARAEAAGREAVERDARDSWAHHAVAHVLEMEGRAEEGVQWMETRAPHWAAEASFFKVHNWWHKALCHLEMEDQRAAMAVYDAQIVDQGPLALNLLDASALLWRLTLGGADPGDRWAHLAGLWAPHLPSTGYAFNDWHAAMAFIGAEDRVALDQLLSAMRTGAGGRGEASVWAQETGVALIEGFDAFWQGDYDVAVQHLMPARAISGRFGGSHAQRDVIDWTLTEAALRGNLPGVARAMAHERLALRPHSPVNRDFLSRALALPLH
ncbi:MAG: tetratricopeptide repeat protein [Pseudomonadota bacterium]